MICSILLASIPLISAHMEMSWPYPIKSKFDPVNTGANVDYNMISPLSSSDYPCKGYQNQPQTRSVASYVAGEKYNMSITGGASHRGGSCQLSLSYDNGRSFKVIKSMIGGCPLSNSYDFTIPTSAPSGDNVLLSWSWVNLVGNREFYQNCACVSVTGSSADASAINQLPDIFLANLGSKSSCTTIEDQEVVYPNPGFDVQYGSGLSSSSQRSSGICKDGSSNPISASTMSELQSSTTQSSLGAPTTLITATRSAADSSQPIITTSSGSHALSFTPAAKDAQGSTISSPQPSFTASSGLCRSSTMRCDSSSSWSVCSADGSSFISMGSVAPGTECINGKLQRTGGTGSCTGVPSIKCSENGSMFMVCDQGEWIPMGPVAPGTKCRDGAISSA